MARLLSDQIHEDTKKFTSRRYFLLPARAVNASGRNETMPICRRRQATRKIVAQPWAESAVLMFGAITQIYSLSLLFKINQNQLTLEAAIMELTNWVEQRGSGDVPEKVRGALETRSDRSSPVTQ